MTDKERFISIFKEKITREGSRELLNYLCSESCDFFTAPASTRYHGAEVGGLCRHSLNVYDCLCDQLSRRRMKDEYGIHYTDENIAIAALLHDVMEDTPVTLQELEKEFPPEVTQALQLLTHRPDTDYFDYVRAVKQNPIARQVKLFDLLHNSDQTRCAFLPAKKRAQLKEKYDRALAILRQP